MSWINIVWDFKVSLLATDAVCSPQTIKFLKYLVINTMMRYIILQLG